jgi:hypothetical protein
MNRPLFFIGLLFVGVAAGLVLMGQIPFGFAAAIAILGIGLVVVSVRGGGNRSKPRREAKEVQTIVSDDGQLRAVIKRRVDGTFQVELWKLFNGYSQEFGSEVQFVRQGDMAIADTLTEAVSIASDYIRG